MIFAEIDVSEAVGTILAHSVAHAGGVYKKGKLLQAADVESLKAAGVERLFAARLQDGDVPEDEAAHLLATRIAGGNVHVQQPFTGRSNLYAQKNGLVLVDAGRLQALNRVHESITVATLPHHQLVTARQMLATVKIIPFAVERRVLERVLEVAASSPIISVAFLNRQRVGLVITRTARSKSAIIEKSETSMRERITQLGSTLEQVIVCDHGIKAVATAVGELQTSGCSPILVFGASAIVDRGDVVPQGVVDAGGQILHLGMPVDPGNLMMLARLGEIPVLGVPSCARSPKVNGFDWILQRVLAGIDVSACDIMDMGAGGLLAEISSRPFPREGRPATPEEPKITAIVLAAGKSSRMGSNKLLADLGGKTIIQRTIDNLRESRVSEVIVVTGNESETLRDTIAEKGIRFVHNSDFAEGLSTSLRCGLSALREDSDGVLVCLGDMPLVSASSIDRLIAAFSVTENRTICVPVHHGKWGNPVLWGREHAPALKAVTGDQGGRALLKSLADEVVEVEMEAQGVLLDVDTPLALADLRSALVP